MCSSPTVWRRKSADSLEAGFIRTDLYEDTNGEGNLHEYNIPSFGATRKVRG